MLGLFEIPFLVTLVAGVLAVVLAAFWLQSGQRPLLYAALACGAIAAAVSFLDRMIESDREQVLKTLRRVVRAVENNDLPAILEQIHPDAASIRQRAAQELPSYEFSRARIRRVHEVRFSEQQPVIATVELNVSVNVSQRQGMIKNRHVPRFVILKLKRQGDEWKVTHYEHHDPRRGFDRR